MKCFLPVLLIYFLIISSAASQQTPADGCLIKGNVSKSKVRLYYTPDHPIYPRVKISPSKGERWFCREVDAKAAGWEPAGVRTNCRADPLDAIPSKQAPVPGCHIKGNSTRIYHMPGGRCYSETIIREGRDKRERWFCSEREAKAAGYRRSRI